MDIEKVEYISRTEYLPFYKFESKEVIKGYSLTFWVNATRYILDVGAVSVSIEYEDRENIKSDVFYRKEINKDNYENAQKIIKSLWLGEKTYKDYKEDIDIIPLRTIYHIGG